MSMNRYIGEWLYYNSDAKSFHTNNLYRRLYSIKVEFYTRTEKSRFSSHPLETQALRDNVRAPPIARWKTHGDFPFVVIELFCYRLRVWFCHKARV